MVSEGQQLMYGPARKDQRLLRVERHLQVDVEADGWEILAVQSPAMKLSDLTQADQRYLAPEYDNLADPVQEAFKTFLEERGMDNDFFAWIHEAAVAKEEKEYVDWLRRVKDFLA